jgi:hypothetical protein
MSEETKGVNQVGKPDDPNKGTAIVGNQVKGTVIVDRNTKTPDPPVEITHGEGDRE